MRLGRLVRALKWASIANLRVVNTCYTDFASGMWAALRLHMCRLSAAHERHRGGACGTWLAHEWLYVNAQHATWLDEVLGARSLEL